MVSNILESSLLGGWFLFWPVVMRAALVNSFSSLFPDKTVFEEQLVTAVAVALAVVQNILIFGVLGPVIFSEHSFSWEQSSRISGIIICFTLFAWLVLALWLRVDGRSARLNLPQQSND